MVLIYDVISVDHNVMYNVILYFTLAYIYNSSHQQQRMCVINANQKNNNNK